MGGVCSKSETKKKKEKDGLAGDAQNNNTNANANAVAAAKAQSPLLPAQPTFLNVSGAADPQDPQPDAAHVEGSMTVAGAAAATNEVRDTGSNFTLSTAHDESRGEADSAFGPHPGSPHKLSGTKHPMHVAASGAACPPPAQKGEHYAQWFPPEHDAGMKLGDGKYTGIGVETPSSRASSAELHSLASTPNYRIPSPAEATPTPPPAPATLARPYDPMRFVDEDSTAPETASSAFATPRELRDGGSVASMADNISLASHGSMMSQHAHGYQYYNSSNTGIDLYASPSSRHQSVGSTSMASAAAAPRPPPSQRTTKTAMTVTNVRNNRQMPTVSGVSPFSRQTSRAASDRFQSCRSIGDASTSAASYLPPTSPAGVVTEADVLLLSAQQGGNYSGRRADDGFGSPVSGAGAATFYSCRSLGTASERSALSPSLASRGPSQAFAPITVGQPTSPFYGVHGQRTDSPSNLRGAALPPRSPGGSPMAYVGNTPYSQQELLQRQASRPSTFGDAPASEAFFSVCGSTQDVFLDLPSAAETGTEYTLEDDRDLELTLRARGAAAHTASSVRSGIATASPASHYSSPAAAAALLQTAVLVGTPASSSTSSAWLAAPAPTSTTKVPHEGQRRTTALPPHIDAPAAVGPAAKAEATASDYDADRSSVATSRNDSLKGIKRKKSTPAASYYTAADFPPNPTTPPQATALKAVAPAAAAETPLAMVVVETAVMDATYVTLSPSSEASTRKSGAARPTVKYSGGDDGAEMDGDEPGDAVRSRALETLAEVHTLTQEKEQQQQQQQHNAMPAASSTHSFSTVASSYRQAQEQAVPIAQPLPKKKKKTTTSPGSSQTEGQKQSTKSNAQPNTVPGPQQHRPAPAVAVRRSVKRRSSLPRSKGPAATTNTATGAALPAPVLTNPNPWVPSGTTGPTQSAHADPYVVGDNGQPRPRANSVGTTPASATTPRTPRSGAGGTNGRGRPVRRSVTSSNAMGGSSIPPGRRSAGATKGTAASGAPEEPPTWSSLTPSPQTTSSAKPIAKLAVAAKARKSKKSAAAAAAATGTAKTTSLATPPPAPSPAADAEREATIQQTTEPLRGDDSVVEYALFAGELADTEADSTTEDAASASPSAPRQPPPQQQDEYHPNSSNVSPSPISGHQRVGFHVSPEVSPSMLTSAETSSFMQPFNDAQLDAQMRSAGIDLDDGDWVTTTTTVTTSTTIVSAAAVVRAEMAEPLPLPEEAVDEGYDADSGLPAAPLGEPSTMLQRPRSVSATSNDDTMVVQGPGTAAETATGASPSATQVNGVAASLVDVAASKDDGVTAVDLSSSSSVSEAAVSVGSPVIVG